MVFKHITVAGSGVLGSQIAFQISYKGFDVSVYDINEDAIEKAKGRIEKLKQRYKDDLNATDEAVNNAFDSIHFYTDLRKAVDHADLVIEAVPENMDVKKEFYKQLSDVAQKETVFASNSSTMLPSNLRGFTDRPEKFLMMHFANEIWHNNTAEIMKHEQTDDDVFNDLVTFGKEIGMISLPIHKEQPGYILNSLLVPFLDAAEELLVKGIADAETIDKTWMIATDSPKGPFGILDIVGMRTPYNLAKAKGEAGDETFAEIAKYLKENYINQGKLGKESGEGFYKYPNPKYERDDFLK